MRGREGGVRDERGVDIDVGVWIEGPASSALFAEVEECEQDEDDEDGDNTEG